MGITLGRTRGVLSTLLLGLRLIPVADRLQYFPLFKCVFDRQKISMLTVFRMLLHGDPSPRESTTGCRTNGLLGQNVHQRLGELAIKRRNVRAFGHDPLNRDSRTLRCR
jgi:hypothetical protein